jgi:SAM-dependent methyltransferase
MLKMYDDLAAWWLLISPLQDYKEEFDFFQKVLLEAGLVSAPTLLELGSGGGNNAFYLKSLFAAVTLTDLSPQMLAISRALNPECEHIEGDMRTLRLDRVFDVVFVHDAVDYMTTPQDLRQAIETAFVHCKPEGLAMFVPDHVRETFQPSTDHDGHDGDGRALRYLEWTHDPDEEDTTYTVEYAYVLREGNQPTRVEHEQHICGLFARDDWLRLLRGVGFRAEIIPDPFERDIFLARKPVELPAQATPVAKGEKT